MESVKPTVENMANVGGFDPPDGLPNAPGMEWIRSLRRRMGLAAREAGSAEKVEASTITDIANRSVPREIHRAWEAWVDCGGYYFQGENRQEWIMNGGDGLEYGEDIDDICILDLREMAEAVLWGFKRGELKVK